MSSTTGSAQAASLFLPDDLDDARRASELEQSDLDALRTVADWIKSFIAQPHKDLGRAGTVCPFVPDALERNTLWLAPEHIANRMASDVVELIGAYQRLFEDARHVAGDDAIYKSFVVVFTDLPVDRARGFFSDLLEQIAVPSYTNDGLVMGGFYKGNEGTAIYNMSFHPFTSPVPFLLVRQAVVSDWKFFLDDERWLELRARRFGASAS